MERKRIFKRKIYDTIMEWHNSPVHNSALLIEGARRIGKSTIVEEFAKKEFPGNYLIVDFRRESDEVKRLFNATKDLDAFYRLFFLSQGKVLNEGGLIVFDEIQFCPKAREAIKDFVADGRYRFIETGSLISIKENTKDIMIPSEERRIDMFPMDFEEFLWATEGNDALPLFDEFLRNRQAIPQEIHETYLQKYRTYILVGGMPKVLSIFLDTNSFSLANQEKMDILKLYRDDLRKHDNAHGTLCGPIFDAIPSQLAKENRRFLINVLGDQERYMQIKESLEDLCDFKIVNRVKSVSSLEGPLELNAEEGRFKLYFCDVGLLVAKLLPITGDAMSKAYFDFINGGKGSLNLGAVFESIAVQQLVIQGLDLYYHRYSLIDHQTGKEKNYELDLVFEREIKPSVIEIKSSKNYTTSSLDRLREKYPQIKTNHMVVGVKNLRFESDKTTIPLYLLSSL